MTLLVLVGPAGVGKGTVVSEIINHFPDFTLSVSATTRKPRAGELDGIHYHFVTKEAFEKLIETNQLLEWAQVHGDNYYGTPLSELTRAENSGKTLILEIDLQGARQVMQKQVDQIQIFLHPPSWDELERRLRSRGTETEEQIQTRLSTAREELAAAGGFSHQLTNYSVHETAQRIVELVQKHERGS